MQTWADRVAGHPLWRLVEADPAVVRLRDRVVGVAGDLAELRDKHAAALAADPWQDRGLATRMLGHLGRLFVETRTTPTATTPTATTPTATTPTATTPTPTELAAAELTAGEVAILVAVPLLHECTWSLAVARAHRVGPDDLSPSPDATSDRAAFERFAQSYPQIYRRAVAAARQERTTAASEIGWWLLHRWAVRQPAGYREAEVLETLTPLTHAGLDGDEGALLGPERLTELLRCFRADPGFLARADRAQALVARAPDGVREQAMGYLLATAYALAVEPSSLPDVIGEHLGIGDPVSPSDVHTTVGRLRWTSRGAALVLGAECDHPAIDVALRSHVEGLNQLLVHAQRAVAAGQVPSPLTLLPVHVSADDVGARRVGAVSAYQSAGVRFRLAEDRVRELLMGEQLYGDPNLAIRELYQNALDACRYRAARTEYLRRGGFAGPTPWDARIVFTQGVDEHARPYVDCVDNGIGMGVHELRDVFSQTGIRTSDLPEFLEEQDNWARLEPPVQFFPNSRFGIGVLSYFMLADEITVETCRLGRDGQPGELLKVSIAGPGSLFRIQSLGQGTDAGTRIRLHLRDGINMSCVDTLRSLLWVADFYTEAVYGQERQVWQPGDLSDASRPRQLASAEPGHGVVAAAELGVWWCGDGGAILADGLWAGQDWSGAVVNLTRERAPRLSVDRTKMLAFRKEDVEHLLWQAVPQLTAAGPTVLTYDWLNRLTVAMPLLADVIFERALADGYRRWRLGDDEVDACVLGCFAADGHGVDGPDQLVEWRLTAMAAAGAYAKVITPGPDWSAVARSRPSDSLLFSVDLDGATPWLDPQDPVRISHLVRCALRVGRSTTEIASRFAELGFTVETGYERLDAEPEDLVLTSRELTGSRPWLDATQPVALPHVLKAAQRTGRSVAQVSARFARLGFTPEWDGARVMVDTFEPADVVILSRDLDASVPWLDPVVPPAVVHLVRAAHATGREVADVAARIAALGYPLPAGCERLSTDPADVILVSRDLDGRSPWLDPDAVVSSAHVLRAARVSGRPVAELAQRLRSLGFSFNLGMDEMSRLDADESIDLVPASCDLDGVPAWLAPTQPVSVVHLLRASDTTHTSVLDVANQLARLGYRTAIDPEQIMADRITSDDDTLISVDLDGEEPYLDTVRPVSAMHVVRASRQLGHDVHAVVARLAVLGFSAHTHVGEVPVDQVTSDDLVLISEDLDGSAPWLSAELEVGVPHVLLAAGRTRRPIRDIAARLVQLGYRVSANLDLVTIDRIKSKDLLVASADLDRSNPWLDSDQPVPIAHLLAAALELRCRLGRVVERLVAMGYRVPDLDVRLPRALPGGG